MSRAPNSRRRALLAAAVLVACALVAAAIVVPCLGGPCQGGTLFSPAQGSGASGASGTAAPGGSGSGPDAGGSTGARREGYSADPATHEAATRLMDVDADYVADTVLIRFAPGVDVDQATALVAATPTLAPHDVTPDELDRGFSEVALAAPATVEDAVVALSGNAGVSIVQPNYLYQIANESTLADDLGLDVAAEVSAAREAASAQSSASDPVQSAASAPAASAEASPAEKSAAPEAAAPAQTEQPAPAEAAPAAPAATDAAPAPAEPGAAPAAEAADAVATADAAPAESAVDDDGAPFSEVPDPVEQAEPLPGDFESSFGVASDAGLATQTAVTVNDFATTQGEYTGQQRSWHLTFIHAFDAWSYLPKQGGQPHNSTSIAVLDNGFQRFNNDLSGKVVAAYNAADKNNDISEASNGHGTHVAGIAGAKVNNSWGTVGTSYDANLVLVKVMDSHIPEPRIKTDYLIEGYRYVMENASRYNIRTINVSIGGRGAVPDSDELLKDGVKAAFERNIVSVMAACNAQSGAAVPYAAYPADYAYCVSVINLQSDGTRKSTSNYNLPGKTNKNISAPGTDIVSSKRDTIASDSGTSMASPVVAGVFSLLFAKRPSLTASQARAIVYATADRMGGADFTEGFGYGKVDALAAMQALEPQISGESSIVVGSSSKLVLSCGATRFTTVSWSSSSNVASVASDGTVTGHGLGTATITATYTIRDNEGDSFTGTATKVVTIGKSFDGAKVSVPNQTFTGSALTPKPTVTYNGTTLREETDYTVGPYYDNVNAGTAWVTITGKGAYAGKTAGSFSISPVNIAGASVYAAPQTYTGSALRPAVSVRAGGRTLSQGRDYDVSYANNTNPGTATVTVTGKGNYTGRATGSFKIVDGGIVMYRLYNPYTGEHFYTASDYERASLARAGWNYEGVGWTAPSVGDSVFRLYNPYAGDHHYTTSWYECQSLQRAGWSYEGVGWKTGSGAPLLRQYNPYATTGTHNYTTSAYERDALIRLGWRDEGIGWRAL